MVVLGYVICIWRVDVLINRVEITFCTITMHEIDHANAGIGERTYYGAYHYPLPGRTFKFGVRWDLTE